jgi:hypothetical protein
LINNKQTNRFSGAYNSAYWKLGGSSQWVLERVAWKPIHDARFPIFC